MNNGKIILLFNFTEIVLVKIFDELLITDPVFFCPVVKSVIQEFLLTNGFFESGEVKTIKLVVLRLCVDFVIINCAL